MPGALEGLRVIDMSRYIAGPFCGQLLGDLGADVVKVERIDGGEEGRRVGEAVAGDTFFFLSANRNKRGFAVDFRDPESQALLADLAAEADILVENFRPGTLEAMGMDWDSLHARNPRLILVRITGFGQDGPMAQHPCFDGAAQAVSGLMSMTGQHDGPPTMAGVFVCDYTTALYATIAALAAVRAREKNGLGQVVEATLMDSGLALMTTAIPEYLVNGKLPPRLGNRDRYLSPSHCFCSRDGGWIYVVAGNDQHFHRFAMAMDLPNLARDPAYATFVARNANVDALEVLINNWAAQHDCEDILAKLHKADVPCEKVATIADVVTNPQVVHRQQIVEVPHPVAGKIPFQAPALKMWGTPTEILRGAPGLGEHSRDVLKEWLGYADDDLHRLEQQGLI